MDWFWEKEILIFVHHQFQTSWQSCSLFDVSQCMALGLTVQGSIADTSSSVYGRNDHNVFLMLFVAVTSRSNFILNSIPGRCSEAWSGRSLPLGGMRFAVKGLRTGAGSFRRTYEQGRSSSNVYSTSETPPFPIGKQPTHSSLSLGSLTTYGIQEAMIKGASSSDSVCAIAVDYRGQRHKRGGVLGNWSGWDMRLRSLGNRWIQMGFFTRFLGRTGEGLFPCLKALLTLL